MTRSLAAQLKADILDGGPGRDTRLKLFELRDRYETTQGKVREALLQLASEGLISYEPKRGFALLPLSVADLKEVTKLRIELECEALRESIKLGGDAWESGIVSNLYLLKKTEQRSSKNSRQLNSQWSERHRNFHRALLSACSSVWRLKFCEQLSDHAERYRRLSIAVRNHQRDIYAEHQAIADAAVARNAGLACRLLAQHFTLTADTVSEALARSAE